ncbi:hypothetical protein Afe04nite_56630 [Asanoa ferruginea]|uniref:hypothetical protein n=1 Tax=Asanoa ferruginea TaxID=53367 RepID=UPI0011C12FC6|nr:hypothetical protein [Asanoa ferruginea]GIF51124.1 hypothetical protein Afe04nite_56630 [Asanoa ferruginea]
MIWLPKSSVELNAIGHQIMVRDPETLLHAVDELISVGSEVSNLKIRAGEHLAALMLTAVCGPPTSIDTVGQVDLLFDREALTSHDWCFGAAGRAAVEVKSYAGVFREVESRIRPGDLHAVTIRSALDILLDASPQIDRAIDALERKTGPQISRNVFLVIHMFDAVAVEAYDEMPFIGHRLPLVAPSVGLDTLWILWHPGMLTMWSKNDQRWIDVIFANEDPFAEEADEMDIIQQAEETFLSATGHRGDSPWLYKLVQLPESMKDL